MSEVSGRKEIHEFIYDHRRPSKYVATPFITIIPLDKIDNFSLNTFLDKAIDKNKDKYSLMVDPKSEYQFKVDEESKSIIITRIDRPRKGQVYNKTGLYYAFIDNNDNIHIGYSFLNVKKDKKFDFDYAIIEAKRRAIKFSKLTDKNIDDLISQRGNAKGIIRKKEFTKFITRCAKYFQDKHMPDWVINTLGQSF